MVKTKEFMKVIEPKLARQDGKIATEKDVLIYSAICAIPIIGQVFWLICLIWYFKYGRKIYYKEL